MSTSRAGLFWYRSRELNRDAFRAHRAGVGILGELLAHLSPAGAWPRTERIAAALDVSKRTVERSLSAYVRAGILVEHRRSWAPTRYELASKYLEKLEATPLPQSSDRFVAPNGRPSGDHRTARPTPQAPAAAATAGGGASPPAPPVPFVPVRAHRTPDAGLSFGKRTRRNVARLDTPAAGVAELLTWYAEAWTRRHSNDPSGERAPLLGREAERRIRTLLAWAELDGARSSPAWVRSYLEAFLLLDGPAADRGHNLADATRAEYRERCRPRRPRPRVDQLGPMPAPPAPTAEQLDAARRFAEVYAPTIAERVRKSIG